MSSTFTVTIPTSDGGSVQIVPDTGQGGFLSLLVINPDSTTKSTTALSSSVSNDLVIEVQGITQFRRAQLAAGN